jgi:hypothetical protein
MANGIRIRANFVGGVVDDNPLTIGATTLTSSTLNQLPPIGATEHAVIVLDPGGAGGAPEIVYVTAHTNGATTATIARAKEGTTSRQHNQNTTWVHSGIASDFAFSKDPRYSLNSDSGTLSDEFSTVSLDGNWTRVDRSGNSAGVTWTQSGDMLSVKSTATDNAGEMHALVKPLGGASFPLTFTTASRHMHRYATNYQMLGIVLADGVTYGSGTQLADIMYVDTSAAGLRPSPRSFTGFNTNVNTYDTNSWSYHGGLVWHRWNWTAANTFTYETSPDGVSWIQLGGTISLTITPTHAGVWISHWGTAQSSIGSFEFFRIS